MAEIQEKILKFKCLLSNNQIDQKYLIQQNKIIYLLGKEEEEEGEEYVESNQQLELFDKLNQKYIDFQNNDEWKIKQVLIFTIIYVSSNSFTDTIISFCQKALIQLWVVEKYQRVRNLLKNYNQINLWMQILQKDWQIQHDRVAGEMQQMLRRIDELQEQISREANLNKPDLQLKEMDETTLITQTKRFVRVEGKINQMKEQVNSMGNDIKFMSRKSKMESFEGSSRKKCQIHLCAMKNSRERQK
ncbi:unnamed protein product [Paramecium pentaurelia]|uniref:Uncharacterized protein n=1 Tax=Paramecium pentaurelia TaxID=43138 RepID=A0A8S1XXK0_9CILI|nr:unnamed protein product [Paramecium pentaurelia]